MSEKYPWPAPLSDAAFVGPVGELVRIVDDHTEADPTSVLVQLLVAIGNMAGRGPHFHVGATEHALNLFVCIVGKSARGRKGDALNVMKRLGQRVDAEWAGTRILSGASTGEGLISKIRDAVVEEIQEEDPETGEKKTKKIVLEKGVEDKRVLIVEEEFARVLNSMERNGNTLSALLRAAWDGSTLEVMTKSRPQRATSPHVSMIAHVTAGELRGRLNFNDATNGFANRFLWVCVDRSKILPNPEPMPWEKLGPVLDRLAGSVRDGQKFTLPMERDKATADLWAQEYIRLTQDDPTTLGTLNARSEPQVARLSAIYALTEGSRIIKRHHLEAALEVARYVEESTGHVFGEWAERQDRSWSVSTLSMLERILQALRATPGGLTRTNIRDIFSKRASGAEIQAALDALKQEGLAYMVREGRVERWFATATPATVPTETTVGGSSDSVDRSQRSRSHRSHESQDASLKGNPEGEEGDDILVRLQKRIRSKKMQEERVDDVT